MIYLFDIFLKKENADGVKVVTYSTLLDNPDILGTLTDVTGYLSLVLSPEDKGYSVNSLYSKYHALLVGSKLDSMLDKNCYITFRFSVNDVKSLRASVETGDGCDFPIGISTVSNLNELVVDHCDECRMFIAEQSLFVNEEISVNRGQLLFVSMI